MANYLRTRSSILAIILLLLASNVYGADKVVVVPLSGDTNYLIEPASILGFYVDFNSTGNVITAYTVPNDKVFVLTDMDGIGCTGVTLSLLENSNTKLLFRGPLTLKSFRSGISFSSGRNINLTIIDGRLSGLCKLTLMGYLH